ncbi:MAG: hypothetical protein WD294_05055 [Phycisphaeraceae bacterium]
MMIHDSFRLSRIGRLAPAFLLPLVLVGCAAPGFLLDAFMPPDRIPAAYTPADRTTVVFVDDPGNVLPQSSLRATLVAAVRHNLTQEEVITTFVAGNRLATARLNEPDFSDWPIDRVGRHVEAEQVLYIRVEQFQSSEPTKTETYRPRAIVRVKLIDVETGQRLFPARDDYGTRVTTTMFFRTQQESRGTAAVLAQTLAQKTGEDVARLFYRHEPRAVGSGWDD